MTLSVCLITKNEAANIAECFESIKSIADEIIVLDTGSTDDTVKIAESLGAKVYHDEWTDDFASARNKSISYATCDWVMWFDADDRLPKKSQEQIAIIKNDPLVHIFAFHIKNINPLPITTALTTLFMHFRMWPRAAGLEFRSRLHESVMASAQENGLILTDTDIIVEHVGYQDKSTVHDKMLRNIKIKLKSIGFPDGADFIVVELSDLICVYAPNSLTIWKDMTMVWLGEPFDKNLIATREEKTKLIEEFVKRNAFV